MLEKLYKLCASGGWTVWVRVYFGQKQSVAPTVTAAHSHKWLGRWKRFDTSYKDDFLLIGQFCWESICLWCGDGPRTWWKVVFQFLELSFQNSFYLPPHLLWFKIFPSDLSWTTAQRQSEGKETLPPATQPDLMYDTEHWPLEGKQIWCHACFTKFK